MITTEDVVRATGGVLLNGDMKISFRRVIQDSRQVRPGDLFVALKGPRFDGHDFVLAAIEAGAKGALVEYWPKNINIFELHRAISIIRVKDTLKALGDLAAYRRRQLKATVVGITGSCGKSTTKEFLTQLLKGHGAYGNPGNWNNLIGAPLSLLNAPEEARFLVFELATNRPGEIGRLAEIINPHVSLLLGVKPAHLEGFSDFGALLREKLSLFEKTMGPIVFPHDQEEIRETVEKEFEDRPRKSFGLREGADFSARNIKVTPRGTSFELLAEGEVFPLTIPLLGRHFVLDLLAALATASFLGEDFRALLPRVPELKTLPRRLELKEARGLSLLDDTYNANPASLKAGVEVVAALRPFYQRAVAVVGDMKELGPESKAFHQEAGRMLAEVFDEILAVGEEASEIAKVSGEKGKFFPEKEALKDYLARGLREGDLVYVKGSRAMKLDELVDQLVEGG